ncbi:GNAT family N-acetyltransferase, partial [Pseudomonas aeruginosa]|nr:GNAT family N-acetyltransferase [Pseudomonas aeruginosa]
MEIQIHVYNSLSQLDSKEYKVFFEKAKAPFFFDWRFLLAAERAPLIKVRKVFYLVARKGDVLRAFLPLYLQKLSDVDPLKLLADSCGLKDDGEDLGLFSHVMHCYDSRLLLSEDDADLRAAMLDAAARLAKAEGARYFAILNVDDASLLQTAELQGLNIKYMVDRFYTCLDGRTEIKDIIETLPGKGRRELFLQLRRFEAYSGAEVKVLSPPFDQRLEQLAKLCHETTARKGTPQFFPTVALADFVRLCGDLARLFVVEIDDRLISGIISYQLDDTLCLWSAGMQYNQTTFSPYAVLVYSAYRYALDNGIRHIEFGRLNAKTKIRMGFHAKPMNAVFSRDLKSDVGCLDGAASFISRETIAYAQWYDKRVWNKRDFGRAPRALVLAEGDLHIVSAINFARNHGLKLCTKTGGHSYAGTFMQQDTLLIDLSKLDNLRVDPHECKVVAQPGVTSKQLSQSLYEYGLAFPTGHARNVTLGGFLLGGGLGINCNSWGGMSVFNVDALDLVTADGVCRHVNANCEPELYWAARGAGPQSFFVVTRFYLSCYKHPKTICSSSYTLTLDQVPTVMECLEQINPPSNIQIMLAIAANTSGDHNAMLNFLIYTDEKEESISLRKHLISQVGNTLEPVEEDRVIGFEDIYKQSDEMLTCSRYRTDNVLTDRVRESLSVLYRHIALPHSIKTVTLIVWRG